MPSEPSRSSSRKASGWAGEVAPPLVQGLVEAGRASEAEELTKAFAAGLSGREAPAAAAALSVCRAQLAEARGNCAEAAEAYLEAERAWQALPRPYEAARAAESAAHCRLGDGEGGRELLLEARTAFHELGAVWDEARVRRTLREHGVIVPYRGGRRGYGSNLSPRETEVAKLACEGLSNREIAVALFLPRKTVERHLSSAMRKLSVTSRWELPERLGVTGREAHRPLLQVPRDKWGAPPSMQPARPHLLSAALVEGG